MDVPSTHWRRELWQRFIQVMTGLIIAQAIPNYIFSHHQNKPLATTNSREYQKTKRQWSCKCGPSSPVWNWLSSWILGFWMLVAPTFEHGEVSPLQFPAFSLPSHNRSLSSEETLGVGMMKHYPGDYREREYRQRWAWNVGRTKNSTPLTGTQNRSLHFHGRIPHLMLLATGRFA